MNVRKLIALFLCLGIFLSFVGCSASVDKSTGGAVRDDYIVREEASADSESIGVLPENRKLIQTVNMSVETENLDTVLQQVNDRVAQLGGYVQTANVQNGSSYSGTRYRSANLTVRIPAQELDAFLDKVGQLTNVVSSQKTVEDVTLSYVATESRVKALQTEEARLLELMTKAESLEDLLTIEARLTDVRTELEEVTSALKLLENQVDYATIHLNISEVKEFTDVSEPENIWERIGQGFEKSLDGVGNFLVEVFVFLIVSLPYMVMLAVIPVGVLLIIRGAKRRRRKNREKQDSEK